MLYSYMSLAGGSLFGFTPFVFEWKMHSLHITRMNLTEEIHEVHTALLCGVVYTPVWETPVIAWIYLSLCGTKVSLCLNSFQVELAEFIIGKHAFPSALGKNFLWPGFVEMGSSFSLYGPLGSISPQEGSETGRLACLEAHHYLWHPTCQQGLPWWGLPWRARDPVGQKALAWWSWLSGSQRKEMCQRER